MFVPKGRETGGVMSEKSLSECSELQETWSLCALTVFLEKLLNTEGLLGKIR